MWNHEVKRKRWVEARKAKLKKKMEEPRGKKACIRNANIKTKKISVIKKMAFIG